MLPALLLFPPTLKPDQPVPQDFALQFWDAPHKPANASLVVGIIGMLVNSKGGSVSTTIYWLYFKMFTLMLLVGRGQDVQQMSGRNRASEQCAHVLEDTSKIFLYPIVRVSDM